MGDRVVQFVVDSYFTKGSLLAHAVVYPVLMGLEGGDYHLFLDGISIEAVFVGLLVGISTKTVRHNQHHLLAALAHHHQKED